MIQTLADLKRALTPGTDVMVTWHRFPELMGKRTIVKAQTKRIKMTLPSGHPRAATVDGSWFDLPRRDRVLFENDEITILDDESGQPLLTLSIPT